MPSTYVIGLTRVWNQERIIEEVLDRNYPLCDWLVILANQITDSTYEKILHWCKGKTNVSLIDYNSIGRAVVHESAERTALYHFGRAIAESEGIRADKATWFYTFDSDEILDCTRAELDEALVNASAPCMTVRLVDFWTQPGESHDFESIFDSRASCEPNVRLRPYFYRHHPDRNIQWKLVADRFHSCTMVMTDWKDHDNPQITGHAPLWVRHYGNCIDEEHEKMKLERYRSFKLEWERASPWAENLPGGKDFHAPAVVPYADLKAGRIAWNPKPLAGR